METRNPPARLLRPLPRIGLTASLVYEDRTPRHRLDEAYTRWIDQCGGIPVILPVPPEPTPAHAEALLQSVQAMVLTGGADIHPRHYGESLDPHLPVQLGPDVRIQFERELVLQAHRRRMPVLGICLGIQTLNVALGGTLYQDLTAQFPGALDHRRSHPVEVLSQSRLGQILRTRSTFSVHSHHHQAVRDVAPGLRVVARAPDGVIEALEDPDHSFFIGVQWHPERPPGKPQAQRLFRALVAAAKAYQTIPDRTS